MFGFSPSAVGGCKNGKHDPGPAFRQDERKD